MVKNKAWIFFFIYSLATFNAFAQDISGEWYGIVVPTSPGEKPTDYITTFTQNGTIIGGTSQSFFANLPVGLNLAYLTGTFKNSTLVFSEANKNGNLNDKNICYWKETLFYDPINESLIGTFLNIYNPGYCQDTYPGTVQLYRIVLKSGSSYCVDSLVNLTVTGKNVRWYDSNNTLLVKGNTLKTTLSAPTTFYLTQTLLNTESPKVAIKVDVSSIK